MAFRHFAGADVEAVVSDAGSGNFAGVASVAGAVATGAASALVVEAKRVSSLWNLCVFAERVAESALPLYDP
jgi:hypothetical protein